MAITELNPNAGHYSYLLLALNTLKSLTNSKSLFLLGSKYSPSSISREINYNTLYASLNSGSDFNFCLKVDQLLGDVIELVYETTSSNYDYYFYEMNVKRYFKKITNIDEIKTTNELWFYVNKKINWAALDSVSISPTTGTINSYCLLLLSNNNYSTVSGTYLPSEGHLMYVVYDNGFTSSLKYSTNSLHRDNIEFFIRFINN